jgi:hypothetical protein
VNRPVPGFKPTLAHRSAVLRAVADVAAADGTTPDGAHLPPLAVIRATAIIEDEARAERNTSVRAAREAGHTWAEIGEALGYSGPGAAADAYRVIAVIPEWFPEWFCRACGRHVQDAGPGMPPADAETGHAGGCTRLAAAAAAWEAARQPGTAQR